jgi:hypothetical protein
MFFIITMEMEWSKHLIKNKHICTIKEKQKFRALIGDNIDQFV